MKKHPKYRRIHTYCKSPKQYWKERDRRKRVLALANKCLTYQEIAEQMGISERTVKRDMHKLRPYRIGVFNKAVLEFRKERQRKLEQQMAGMNLRERLGFISKKLVEEQKLMRRNEYHKHAITFTINLDEIQKRLDDQPYGRPFITVTPKTINCRLHDLRLKFRIKAGDQLLPYSTLAVT